MGRGHVPSHLSEWLPSERYVLVRMWRKGNLCALLMAMYVSTDIMEKSIEVPHKIKNKTTIRSSNSTSKYLFKGNNHYLKKTPALPFSLQ